MKRINILPSIQNFGQILNEEGCFTVLKLVTFYGLINVLNKQLKITTKVNQTHFKSKSWKSYLNITKLISQSRMNLGFEHLEFPSVVTSTVNGKLKNKLAESIAICICKVGNMKLYVFIGLMLLSVISTAVFTLLAKSFICK